MDKIVCTNLYVHIGVALVNSLMVNSSKIIDIVVFTTWLTLYVVVRFPLTGTIEREHNTVMLNLNQSLIVGDLVTLADSLTASTCRFTFEYGIGTVVSIDAESNSVGVIWHDDTSQDALEYGAEELINHTARILSRIAQ